MTVTDLYQTYLIGVVIGALFGGVFMTLDMEHGGKGFAAGIIIGLVWPVVLITLLVKLLYAVYNGFVLLKIDYFPAKVKIPKARVHK